MFFRWSDRALIVDAPAKLNLFLRIVRKRPDGFHDIDTVMSTINLFDTLEFSASNDNAIRLTVELAVSPMTGVSVDTIPTDPENLVVRAAELLRLHTGATPGADVRLIKRIPSAAGMGGGSSDAAAALLGLNALWGLGLSTGELVGLAAQLGSDVAFFLGGSTTARCTGRGEILEPLNLPEFLHFVVAKPQAGLSTPLVYKHCRPDTEGLSPEGLIAAWSRGAVAEAARCLHNGLQAPAESLSEAIRGLREVFDRLPVLGHQLSGSGTAYFGVCHNRGQALQIAGRLRSAGYPWVFVTRSCT